VHKKSGGYTVEETAGVVFMFDNKILATHNHTIVADGWRNEIVMSGEKRIYRLDSNKGRLAVEGACAQPPEVKDGELTVQPDGKGYTFQQAPGSIMVYENARFVEQALTGDWTNNPSDFDDALKTLKLTQACDRAASGGYMG
jgi:predicted dehydrogenase